MKKENIEGFLSIPFFDAIKNHDISEEEVMVIFSNISNIKIENEKTFFYEQIIRKICLKDHNFYINHREKYIEIVKESILEQLVIEDVIKCFADSDDENEKAIKLIERKQFNSKLVKIILSRFSYISHLWDIDKLSLILRNLVINKSNQLTTDLIIAELGNFKTIIDNIAAGVKLECYLEFMSASFSNDNLCEDLCSYINDKYGYQLNDWQYYSFYSDIDYKNLLSVAVYNDESFWNIREGHKSIYVFLNLVVKYNSLKHAEKIVDYAFSEICKDEKGKYLYEHKLPLIFKDNLENKMTSYATQKLKNKLGSIIDLNLSEEETKGLIYPINSNYDKEISIGEQIFKKFIKLAYHDEAEQVFQIFENLDNVIQDSSTMVNGIGKRRITLHHILETDIFGYGEYAQMEEYLSGYYGKYSNNKLVLKRFYYRVYLVSKYARDINNECLYEVFFDLFDMMNLKYNLKCHYRIDDELRNFSYNNLKTTLKKYDFTIDDGFKQYYIAALLDRKHATLNERDLYAELEQLGDAIYELAVSNILFFNQRGKLNDKLKEQYVKADAQVIVSKYLGIDKVYISKLNMAFNNKYLPFEYNEVGLRYKNDTKHYLADSLEMVIAAVSKEFGIQKALDFATKVITKTFTELKPPLIMPFSLGESYSSKFDNHYLNKIFPAPYADLDNSSHVDEYICLTRSVEKLLQILILGNETKEQRRFNAYNVGRGLFEIDDSDNFYDVVKSYLYDGLEITMNRYKDIVIKNYKDKFIK